MFKEPYEGQCTDMSGSVVGRLGRGWGGWDGQGQISWGIVGALGFGSRSWQNELHRASTEL